MGFKPLCIGKRDNAYILASETCALETIGAEFVRDVEPGEIVTITADGISSDKGCACPTLPEKPDVSLSIFILPDRTVFLTESAFTRPGFRPAGSWPRIHRWRQTWWVGVPESGNAAALGYAMESGIPYGTAFVKNSYVGRTFIKPKQSSRESAVRIKLNVLKEAVSGKRVIMIDDSIVRGTTSALIVKMLRDAGAREVHVRISAPPFLHPCYFGTDIPSEDQPHCPWKDCG